MKILDNIQKSIYEILSLLQNNMDIRKLVYYDTTDALAQPDITNSTSAEHFTVSAIFDITEPPFDKNTIISVVLNRGNYDEESVMMRNLVKINILTRSALWKLDNQQIRPLQIANLTIDILNNFKIMPSHKLVFSNMELAILNEDVNGYTLTFFLEEGSGMNGEF